jgi:hypothetical protein
MEIKPYLFVQTTLMNSNGGWGPMSDSLFPAQETAEEFNKYLSPEATSESIKILCLNKIFFVKRYLKK